MEQKGSMLLKVISIIMIIGGILSAVASLALVLFAGATSAFISDPQGQSALAGSGVSGAAVNGVVWAAAIIAVIGAVIEIIAGVKGKKNWNNPDQAKTLMIWGIITAVISLISNILFATGGTGVQIVSILAGLVIPVLYIIGTVQLKKQA